MPDLNTQILLRGLHGVGSHDLSDNVVQGFRATGGGVGPSTSFRVFDSLTWVENLRVFDGRSLDTGKICAEHRSATPAPSSKPRIGPSLTYSITLRWRTRLRPPGRPVPWAPGHGGALETGLGRGADPGLKAAVDCRMSLPTHDTAEIACGTILGPCARGLDAVVCAMDALSVDHLSRGRSAPIVEGAAIPDRDTPGCISGAIARSAIIGRPCAPITRRLSRHARLRSGSTSTSCPAGSSPTSRRRRDRWGWRHQWQRWRKCLPT